MRRPRRRSPRCSPTRATPVETARARIPITVPTWVHVITDGLLGASDTAARDQIVTLNAAYSGHFGGVDTGIRFRLDGLTRTTNALWFRDPLTNERAIKRMRKGGPETLNLYIAQLGRLVLGYSTYPLWYKDEPMLDGVVIDWRSLPGGSLRNFDRGFTGVHEIGHWFGLLHTFENGCAAPGDGVADTSPEAEATDGCATRQGHLRGRRGRTRSTTSWTTPTTVACRSSPPARRSGCRRRGPPTGA